jgi:hypothetical protein
MGKRQTSVWRTDWAGPRVRLAGGYNGSGREGKAGAQGGVGTGKIKNHTNEPVNLLKIKEGAFGTRQVVEKRTLITFNPSSH